MTFDTARTAAIAEILSVTRDEGWRALFQLVDEEDVTALADDILARLLAARSSTTCEECGGLGATTTKMGTAPCEPCDGSGTVPGGPLVLLAPEQVGTQLTDAGDGSREAVFVAREST